MSRGQITLIRAALHRGPWIKEPTTPGDTYSDKYYSEEREWNYIGELEFARNRNIINQNIIT